MKFVYWITEAEECRLREEMETSQINMRSAKGVVCTPLTEKNKISSVAPEVWRETCARQGSWYRVSEKNGLYLVVSSFELVGYEDKREATITFSDFHPSRLPTSEEKMDMISDPGFSVKIPSEWQNVNETEKRVALNWAGRLGSDIEDYDLLFLTHTANHANFINPRFFIKEDPGLIPFSIDRSAHLCSCCLELFQVLGSKYPKKLVAPCAGAVIFANLKPDQYLLVKK
ncbi:hypothetical protein ACFL7M_16765 [Thermodesulfobacteriota bacterium]